ncbi:NAD(P)/FAD-dependent oxidoreductase [Clostridium sp. NSJ-27]|uniref:NAD(P)/FAD-dependent oxidoreductase n=2 Tax=Clostridium facile TaxID=2763035 RepID=A0ABR7INB2_9CLOT|nr:NAD(P)/FAD-dependent oxidoreductase [Clostridium facile]MBC5786620.1 NAD(P)/FAD-dependent oxidoreductase [Clostridium facile]
MADLVVIGGGAAGLMAASTAAIYGKQVVLLERNDRVGKKILITGKGRCNVTNNSDLQNLIAHVPKNGKFLYSAFSQFSAEDAISFFESLGVPLKTERGNRVFPVSDRAGDIVSCLERYCKDCGVKLLHKRAKKVLTEKNKIVGVKTTTEEVIPCHAVVVATGGKSYPRTGSTGDGYLIAEKLGHRITPVTASLVPIETNPQDGCKEMMGLSLRNVILTVTKTGSKQVVYSQMGEMLFTHFGISGPLVLSASSHMREMQSGKYQMEIDLKPALSPEQLDARLIRDFSEKSNKDFINLLRGLLPAKMVPVMAKRSGIPFDLKGNQITREMRERLCYLFKHFELTPERFRPVEEAIITSGGVDVSQVNPKTMESKIQSGLYFAGEILDVDAYTGGYNLQIAWSTGYLAGLNAE